MSRPDKYKLIGKLAVPCSNFMEWAIWLEGAGPGRIVKQEMVGPLRVSTVFLGLDYNFDPNPDAEPLLFETMIFGIDPDDSYQTRCSTWDQAERMHEVAVAEARSRYEQALKALSDKARMD